MEAVALRLTRVEGWTYLGGDAEAKKPLEGVIRAFEHPVLAAVGEGPDAPTGEPVEVPAGEGRRLEGRHFFARPGEPARPCRVSYRGF